jgi:hypothetical protein
MAIKDVICAGIGYSPSNVGYVVTRGFGNFVGTLHSGGSTPLGCVARGGAVTGRVAQAGVVKGRVVPR